MSEAQVLNALFDCLRKDKRHHLGLGDIRLTLAQQDDICTRLADTERQLREAQERCARLEADAKRYAFFRDHYQWRRYRDERDLEESYAFIGLKFAYEHDFSCAAMLDYHIDAALSEPDEMTRERDVFELRLCEQSHLILKPNQLYRFTVDKTCEACRAIAAEYVE